MPPSTFKIENAKSGRAKCKGCKELIAKDELRIVRSAYSETQDMTFISNYHTACFKVPPVALAGVSPEEFVEEHLEDCSREDVLDNATIAQKIIDDISSAAAKKKKKKSTKKSTNNTVSDEEEEERPTKKAKATNEVAAVEAEAEASPTALVDSWVGCERCDKWRRLPVDVPAESLPDEWFCSMNTWDANYASCDVPEEVGAQ